MDVGLKAPNLALFKLFLALINFSYNPRGRGVTFMATISKPIAWLSGAILLSCIYIVPCQPFSALHPHLGHSWETFDASARLFTESDLDQIYCCETKPSYLCSHPHKHLIGHIWSQQILHLIPMGFCSKMEIRQSPIHMPSVLPRQYLYCYH